MLHEQQEIIEIYFTEESVIYNGKSYTVSLEKLSHFKKLNNYRIKKGDSISNQILKKAIDNFGLKKLAD